MIVGVPEKHVRLIIPTIGIIGRETDVENLSGRPNLGFTASKHCDDLSRCRCLYEMCNKQSLCGSARFRFACRQTRGRPRKRHLLLSSTLDVPLHPACYLINWCGFFFVHHEAGEQRNDASFVATWGLSVVRAEIRRPVLTDMGAFFQVEHGQRVIKLKIIS